MRNREGFVFSRKLKVTLLGSLPSRLRFPSVSSEIDREKRVFVLLRGADNEKWWNNIVLRRLEEKTIRDGRLGCWS